MIKKALFILCLFVVAIVNYVLFQGSSLYERARAEPADNEKKIAILEREQKYFPLNDLVFYELGKAYFDVGVNRLEDIELRDSALKKSYENFLLSLAINPFSASAHFDFAQALLYMDFFSLPFKVRSFDEFKKAAELTGHNTQIYYEVAKVFFTRWSLLSKDEKDFTLALLKKVLSGKDQEKLLELFNVWDLHVKDYNIIRKILPVELTSYRLYAQFLGERSLSREERIKFLAQAEFLEFEKARSEFNTGQRDFLSFRLQDAYDLFQNSLESLKKIKFYQTLTGQTNIDFLEFKNIQKFVYLDLAKCKIEETRRLEDAAGFLYSYLALEDKIALVGELESFLKERGLIEEKTGANFKDFNRFSFELLLNFKQNRYRDIVESGNVLEQSFLIIPDSLKEEYASVLEIVGDAYQKLDYLYESNNFYQKSLDIRAGIGVLFKMRKNYERLNNSEQVKAIDENIQKLLTANEVDLAGVTVAKGEVFAEPLTLDGKKVRLTLSFNLEPAEPWPLISVFFNGQVIWEDYLKEPSLSLELNSGIGLNTLEVIAVNQPVSLFKLTAVPLEILNIESALAESALKK